MTDVEHRSERGKTGDGMHHDAAREIEHAPTRKQAAAPDHVREGVINEQLPEDEKGKVGLKGDSIDEGAGNEGRRNDGEHHLVSHEDEFRQTMIAGKG